MKHIILVLALLGSPITWAGKVDPNAVIGGAIGGATGAAVGSAVGGREGAIVGSAIGAAAGTAIATDGEKKVVAGRPCKHPHCKRHPGKHKGWHKGRGHKHHDHD